MFREDVSQQPRQGNITDKHILLIHGEEMELELDYRS